VIVALVAILVVWNIATQYRYARSQGQLLEALMARNASEYAMIRRSDAPKGKPAAQPEPQDVTGFTVGMS
jgi:hypothetical protein